MGMDEGGATRRRLGSARPRGVLALIALLAAIVLAACGSSDDGGAESGTSADAPAASAAPAAKEGLALDELKELAKQAAEKDGGPAELPPKTIGFLNVLASSEAGKRYEQGAIDAADLLGWKVVAIDAQGNPQRAGSGITSLVNQDVDGIISLALPPAFLNEGLKAAAEKGIPVINIGSPIEESPLFSATYVQDQTSGSKQLNEYMLSQLPDGAKVAAIETPAQLGQRHRFEQLRRDIAAQDSVELVAEQTVEQANLVEDTKRRVKATLLANPDLDAFWGDIAPSFFAMTQAVREAGKCGKVKIFGATDDQLNLEAIRSGCATALATSPSEADSWAAIDRLAQYFAREQELEDLPATWRELEEIYGVAFRDGDAVKLITKDNLPPEGEYVEPVNDFTEFFPEKWRIEFGAGE